MDPLGLLVHSVHYRVLGFLLRLAVAQSNKYSWRIGPSPRTNYGPLFLCPSRHHYHRHQGPYNFKICYFLFCPTYAGITHYYSRVR